MGRSVFYRESLGIEEDITLMAGQGVRELSRCHPDTHQFLGASVPWHLQSSVCYRQRECQQPKGNFMSYIVFSCLVCWQGTQRKNQLAHMLEDITEPTFPDLPR